MVDPHSPVRIHYTKAPDHRFVFADGAVSRITSSGQLALDFYLGMYEIFDEIYKLKEDNKSLDKKIVEPDGEIPHTRELQSTVLLSMETAQSLRDLLTQKLDEIKKVKGELA